MRVQCFINTYKREAVLAYCFWFKAKCLCVGLQVIEDELRERIERLETRQATDDASLLILNRYWNQVNKFRRGSKKSLFNI